VIISVIIFQQRKTKNPTLGRALMTGLFNMLKQGLTDVLVAGLCSGS
jgi:hypothetical protein